MRLILALLVACSTLGVSQSVEKKPVPGWVEGVTYSDTDADTLEDAGGYRYLLIDRQFNVVAQESFRHTATKVLTESGLETVSAINVNFDPAFQRVYFHTLLVKRGDEVFNKLPQAKFEILRREENLDRLVYDKSLNAILNLDDIQVGDIVEYSYTIRGHNPIFKGKFTRVVYFNYADPVGTEFIRVVTAENRRLWIKIFNGAAEPEELSANGKTIYTWRRENVPAHTEDDNTPAWFDSYDNAEMSEFNSWGEINAWAMPLYATAGAIPEVDKKVAEIRHRYVELDEQVNACIRFVQDEIRYLSFSDGISGYKPHPPAQIIRQRFGDCKDKSLLLTYMLRRLGVSAHPALVNTSTTKMLAEQLPSPTAFDHCITQFTLNDSTYWIDPTLTLQRGKLKGQTTPNYHQALVIGEGTTALTAMKAGDAWRSRIQVKEEYTLDYVGGPAKLMVQSTYYGAEANSIRNYWKSHSASEMKKTYTSFYANEYPGIKADSNIVFTDDDQNNVIISREYYTIKNMWRYDSAKGQYAVEFYARLMADYLRTPSVKSRTMPLAVNYPAAIDQNIIIHVPEPWSISEENKKISSPAFVYTSSRRYLNNIITLSYAYQALDESVDVTQADYHIGRVSEAAGDLQYMLTYDTGTTHSSATRPALNMPYIIILILLTPLLFLAFRKLYYYDPRVANYTVAYEHVGGIMILPLIGIVVRPLRLTYDVIKANYFDPLQWRILTDSSYTGYDPNRGLLVLWEFLHNIGLIAFSILLVILLFKRRTSFPLLTCIFYGVMVAGTLIDAVWLHLLGYPTGFEPDNSALPASLGVIIAAAIWIPYFLRSDRVKGTFRERLD